MGSLAAYPEIDLASVVGSPFERRLCAEWDLLSRLAALNPGRLTDPGAQDTTFFVTLNRTPAIHLNGETTLCEHRVRVVYPRYFPSLPLELSLDTPVFHPNIHPVTGFVCLWDQHRASNTIEHALHKTAAILGWKLFNLDPRHTMQPAMVTLAAEERVALADRLTAPVLQGIAADVCLAELPSMARRVRLT